MQTHTKTHTHLHFDLSFLAIDTPTKLHVGRQRIVLKRHTTATLKTHRALNTALHLIPDEKITHYAESVALPTSTAQMLLVTTPAKSGAEKLDTMLLSMIHVPRAAREKALSNRLKDAHKNTKKPHPKLASYGVLHSAEDDPSPIIDVHDFKTAMDAAISLVFHHVELTNIGGTTSAIVTDIIEYSNGISDLAMQILLQAQAHLKNPTK